jgi:hypothetical protein
MTIETKFEVGQEVFVLRHNKICQVQVSSLEISVNKAKDETFCRTVVTLRDLNSPKDAWFAVAEQEVFATKEELLSSL